jgi:hypothetical protein
MSLLPTNLPCRCGAYFFFRGLTLQARRELDLTDTTFVPPDLVMVVRECALTGPPLRKGIVDPPFVRVLGFSTRDIVSRPGATRKGLAPRFPAARHVPRPIRMSTFTLERRGRRPVG